MTLDQYLEQMMNGSLVLSAAQFLNLVDNSPEHVRAWVNNTLRKQRPHLILLDRINRQQASGGPAVHLSSDPKRFSRLVERLFGIEDGWVLFLDLLHPDHPESRKTGVTEAQRFVRRQIYDLVWRGIVRESDCIPRWLPERCRN